jgi:hypothetical protein
MSANKKLTGVLAGRTVERIDQDGGTATVQFDDGSIMTVQTAGGAATSPGSASALGRVRAVRQQGTTLDLDLETGATLTLRTAEPTSSVIVRAGDRTLEYAD